MKIIISASNALNKWLQLDSPRMPSPKGRQVGVQKVTSNAQHITWQCHVIQNTYGSVYNRLHTVIAIEPFSRYTLLLPFDFPPSKKELEDDLIDRWGNEYLNLMIKHLVISKELIPLVIEQFEQEHKEIIWYRNTDLSVSGHVSDAEQWVHSYIDQHNIDQLNNDNALDLGHHINNQFKRVKNSQGRKEKFHPIPRFLDDGLFRFAKGLAQCDYDDAHRGNFPMPWKTEQAIAIKETLENELPDNVVSLADFRKK